VRDHCVDSRVYLDTLEEVGPDVNWRNHRPGDKLFQGLLKRPEATEEAFCRSWTANASSKPAIWVTTMRGFISIWSIAGPSGMNQRRWLQGLGLRVRITAVWPSRRAGSLRHSAPDTRRGETTKAVIVLLWQQAHGNRK